MWAAWWSRPFIRCSIFITRGHQKCGLDQSNQNTKIAYFFRKLLTRYELNVRSNRKSANSMSWNQRRRKFQSKLILWLIWVCDLNHDYRSMCGISNISILNLSIENQTPAVSLLKLSNPSISQRKYVLRDL